MTGMEVVIGFLVVAVILWLLFTRWAATGTAAELASRLQKTEAALAAKPAEEPEPQIDVAALKKQNAALEGRIIRAIGQKLGEDADSCEVCGASMLAVFNYCPHCGNAVGWDERRTSKEEADWNVDRLERERATAIESGGSDEHLRDIAVRLEEARARAKRLGDKH
jgi:hypothetical protein